MWVTAIVAISALLLAGLSLFATLRRERRDGGILLAAREAGLCEPASLHPLIDPDRCLGSGSCVAACPERDVLGMIEGRAQLLDPSGCIGHGACRDACGAQAITLVFGSERRGVEIPLLRPTFETSVPGIYIAGELGGMGLIGNAIEQGRQAVESIVESQRGGNGADLDLIIVGAGPAGFAASLAAMERGLRFATIEQESLGGTVAHYPRRKLVMTRPVRLPLVGKVPFRETSKEELIRFWKEIERRVGLEVRYRERVEHVSRAGDLLEVSSTRGVCRARAVLLAIGRRGTPRKLGVPGEEQGKVVYRLIEPEQYRARKILVVGGGDSALEAAMAVAEQADTMVSLSYRGEAFSRAKPRNRERVRQARGEGRLNVLLRSTVRCIERAAVAIDCEGRALELDNDNVIVCAGGVLPTPFLAKLGIELETKFGTA